MPEQTEEKTTEELTEAPELTVPDLLARVEQLEEAVLELLAKPEAEAMVAYSAPAQPTRGRIVDYHTAAQSYSAIITAVYQTGAVDLVVFGSPFGAAAIRSSVLPGGPGVNHRWSWPVFLAPADPTEEGDDE